MGFYNAYFGIDLRDNCCSDERVWSGDFSWCLKDFFKLLSSYVSVTCFCDLYRLYIQFYLITSSDFMVSFIINLLFDTGIYYRNDFA